MSLCHDYRVMQVERGYWCVNAVNHGLNFPKWMTRLMRLESALVTSELFLFS